MLTLDKLTDRPPDATVLVVTQRDTWGGAFDRLYPLEKQGLLAMSALHRFDGEPDHVYIWYLHDGVDTQVEALFRRRRNSRLKKD